MPSFQILPLLVGAAYALPQAASTCVTTTLEIIVPTTTYTFFSTSITTFHASSAQDLSTFTDVVRVSSTKMLQTMTSTTTACTANGTTTVPVTSTVYTSAGAASANPTTSSVGTINALVGYSKRDIWGRQTPAEPCTVTSTFSTTYGATEVYRAANKTSTFTEYTAFTQATVTSTSYGGTAYTIATALATTSAMCGPTVNATRAETTKTVTMDGRCAPSAMVSAHQGYGLEYSSDTPASGATYVTSTNDASECCQLCAEAQQCAASSWDIRTNQCRLEFPTDPTTGNLNCGEALLAYYDAGPNHPMAPGSGLYVAQVCGNAQYGQAAPDDGT